jgi:cytochrome c biogenesis protein CcmG/thiol:disulfide interchange protein DsbE
MVPTPFRIHLFLTGLFAVSLSLSLPGCRPSADSSTQLAGRPAPPLSLVPLNGVSPSPELTGRLTLLNFWGTWCPPCRRELPGLVRLANRLADEPRFQLLAVSCGGGGGPDNFTRLQQETEQFLATEGLTLSAWADPSGQTRQAFARELGFDAFPTSYLIGSDGRIMAVWRGYSSTVETEIAQAVATALKQLAASGEPSAAD